MNKQKIENENSVKPFFKGTGTKNFEISPQLKLENVARMPSERNLAAKSSKHIAVIAAGDKKKLIYFNMLEIVFTSRNYQRGKGFR